jgi:hypothetical protein
MMGWATENHLGVWYHEVIYKLQYLCSPNCQQTEHELPIKMKTTLVSYKIEKKKQPSEA